MNDYDKGYLVGLDNIATTKYVNVDKSKTISLFNQGYLDAIQYLGRDASKSELATDKSYQDFLRKVAESIKLDYNKNNIPLEVHSVSWCIGGTTGASCYGNDHITSISSEEPVELEVLDKILLKIVPNISFLLYKNLLQEIVKVSTYSDSDYYGNYTETMIKYFRSYDLFNYLKVNNVI